MTTRSQRARKKRPIKDPGPLNPRWTHDNLLDLSWCRVCPGEFPEGRQSTCCNRRIVVGDLVVTAPSFDGGEVVGTAVMHVGCMKAFMETVPSPMEIVQREVAEIRRLHVVK